MRLEVIRYKTSGIEYGTVGWVEEDPSIYWIAIYHHIRLINESLEGVPTRIERNDIISRHEITPFGFGEIYKRSNDERKSKR